MQLDVSFGSRLEILEISPTVGTGSAVSLFTWGVEGVLSIAYTVNQISYL